MKLCISNISWAIRDDEIVLKMLHNLNYSGIEIAPTKWFATNPYQKLDEAKEKSYSIFSDYGLTVTSMQSICYGKTDNFFSSHEEFESLLKYCMQSIDFAVVVGCANIVFGCPKNRNKPEAASLDTAVSFFNLLGDYAVERQCIIALEPNPTLYGTNFLNTTQEAWEFVRLLKHPGIKLNLDLGTILANGEDINQVADMMHEINHVHLSEPCLLVLQNFEAIDALLKLLRVNNYDKAVSIEMGQSDLETLNITLKKLADLFYA